MRYFLRSSMITQAKTIISRLERAQASIDKKMPHDSSNVKCFFRRRTPACNPLIKSEHL